MKADLENLGVGFVRPQKTTSAMIADILREAILNGTLRGGQQLVQDELAAQFGVSKIPLREALRQLEGEGLVISYLNRGVVVCELSGDELQELCDIRIALETSIIRLALPHLTESILIQAAQILDQIDYDEQSAEKWGDYNWQFHQTLYAPAGRPQHLALIKTLHTRFERYLRVHLTLLKYKEQGQAEHRQILAACREKKLALVTQLTEQHIAEVAQLLATYLSKTT